MCPYRGSTDELGQLRTALQVDLDRRTRMQRLMVFGMNHLQLSCWTGDALAARIFIFMGFGVDGSIT